jgi:hypothetical protein
MSAVAVIAVLPISVIYTAAFTVKQQQNLTSRLTSEGIRFIR